MFKIRLAPSGFFAWPAKPPPVPGSQGGVPPGARGRKLFASPSVKGRDGEPTPHEHGLTIRAIAQARVFERAPAEYLRHELFGGGLPADEQALFAVKEAPLLVTGHQDGFVR